MRRSARPHAEEQKNDMTKNIFVCFLVATLATAFAACESNDKPRTNGAYTYRIAPRKELPRNYVVFDIAEGDIARFEGRMLGNEHEYPQGDNVFDPEVGMHFDSLHLSRYVEKDGTVVVGYVAGDWKRGVKPIDGIRIAPDGTVTPFDTAAVNRVVKVVKGRLCYMGCATQRDVKRRGGQGGRIVQTKNVIDTLGISAHVYPNGDMFVGKMVGDLGAETPDFLEGFYETALGEVYYVPEERKYVDELVKKANAATQPAKGAKWASLLERAEDLSQLYGAVAENYDTPPTLDGQAAATAPLRFEPYATDGKPATEHSLTVRFLVNADGTPTAIQVTDCKDPEAMGAARGLIRKQTFRPATKGGKPVKAWVKRTLHYKTAQE